MEAVTKSGQRACGGYEAQFTAALGLSSPWHVTDIRFTPDQGEIHFDVGCRSPRLSCPACSASDQAIHDRRDRTWQHLHFFQYCAFIHAQLPRVGCDACGKTT
ncbi:MAG: transposase family protein [Gammaproteobacteria bacterium]|nr:transposase family protein [Gammaproteobacteria bacterium]